MSWREIEPIIKSGMTDIGPAVALRAAWRVTPFWMRTVELSITARTQTIPALRLLLRSMMLMAVISRSHRQIDSDVVTEINAKLASYMYRIEGVSTVRCALRSFLPLSRMEKTYEVRAALQSATDLLSNLKRDLPWVRNYDFWKVTKEDVEDLSCGSMVLSYPLPAQFKETEIWKKFSGSLIAFDESWAIWLEWLEYRIMGVSGDNVPVFLWNKIEDDFFSLGSAIWGKDDIGLNSTLAAICLARIEEFVDDQSEKEQIKFSNRFFINEEGRIDLSDEVHEKQNSSVRIVKSVISEVYSQVSSLLELCQGNATAQLRPLIEDYVENIDNGSWHDSHLLVLRGDALRKFSALQRRLDPKSDVFPLEQSTLNLLDNAISAHNLLINSHENLSQIDKMLIGIDDRQVNSSRVVLRKLLENAAAQKALTNRAKAQIEYIVEAGKEEPAANVFSTFTLINLIKSSLSYIWKAKKAFKVTGSLAGAYAVGKWAIANEGVILGYFPKNSEMYAFASQVLKWLHTMPLL